MNDWRSHITLAESLEGAQACLRRNGMLVAEVLELLADEPDLEKLCQSHSDLSREEAIACIALAADPDAHAKLVEDARREAVPAAGGF